MKITDLSTDDIKKIVNDMFKPDSISTIYYNTEADEISMEITTTWTAKIDGKEQDTEMTDELILRNPFLYDKYEAVEVDFEADDKDYEKWKQFCYAKGITNVALEQDNPYLDEER